MDKQVDEIMYEVYKIESPMTCDRDKHVFEYVTGTQIECKKCHTGYATSTKMRLEKGHIYIGDMLMI